MKLKIDRKNRIRKGKVIKTMMIIDDINDYETNYEKNGGDEK